MNRSGDPEEGSRSLFSGGEDCGRKRNLQSKELFKTREPGCRPGGCGPDGNQPIGFGQKLGIPFYQIRHGKNEGFPGNCFKVPAADFLLLTG